FEQLTEVYLRVGWRIRRFIERRLWRLSVDIRDDVEQETLSEICEPATFRRWDRHSDDSFVKFALRIASCKMFAHFERQGVIQHRTRTAGHAFDRHPSRSQRPDQICIQTEIGTLVRRMVCQLSKVQRRILILVFLFDQTLKEVAFRLGMTRDQVVCQFSNAVAELRRTLPISCRFQGMSVTDLNKRLIAHQRMGTPTDRICNAYGIHKRTWKAVKGGGRLVYKVSQPNKRGARSVAIFNRFRVVEP
ncbi:MAG: sigma-70 family RNA polymerase sigma factor, partial [Planctomycetaceae bacterium]|nr:sigma-70 family RNA polymerase sigma factor [Planctomycetaceae bacterium]